MNLIWIFRDSGVISCASFSSPGGGPTAAYCGCLASDRRKMMWNSLGCWSNVCSEIDAVNLVNKANSVHNLRLVYFLYVFRANMYPSSGETTVFMDTWYFLLCVDDFLVCRVKFHLLFCVDGCLVCRVKFHLLFFVVGCLVCRVKFHLLFCVDDCLVCRVQWNFTLHTRQSSTQNNKYQVSHKHNYFSWRWHIVARNM